MATRDSLKHVAATRDSLKRAAKTAKHESKSSPGAAVPDSTRGQNP